MIRALWPDVEQTPTCHGLVQSSPCPKQY